MRATPVVVFVLVVSACVASVEGGPSEPSVSLAAVTTAAVATTTEQVTTTADPDACPPGGGGQTSRGFYCPPDLPVPGQVAGAPLAGATLREFNPAGLAPGTYQTRFFPVSFMFTVAEAVRSFGEDEDGDIVDLGGTGPSHGTFIMERSLLPRPFQGTGACLEADDPVETGAFDPPVVMEVFNVVQDDCTGRVGPPSGAAYTFTEWGDTFGLIDLDIGDHQITVLVLATADEFDTYFAEVAEPLLDSIRFLDQ